MRAKWRRRGRTCESPASKKPVNSRRAIVGLNLGFGYLLRSREKTESIKRLERAWRKLRKARKVSLPQPPPQPEPEIQPK